MKNRNFRGGQRKPKPGIAPDNSMRAVYNSVGYKPGFISTQGYLRLERNLVGAMNTIQFDLLENVNKNAGQTFPTEQRLVQADMFTVLRIGFFIGSYVTTTENRSSMRLRTYPNENVFTAAGALALQQIYAGWLMVQIGVTQYVRQQRISSFYRVPQSQEGTAVSTVATTGVIQHDAWTDSNYGMINYTPTFELQGIQNYIIQVQLPQDATLSLTSPVANTQNVAILMFEGVYHQRGSAK